ncbi:hypothetical protein Taro_041037 [Colocasia esculenta]|uniref:Uncharacterized protein n=1 Tax=Colocasia esculenta TaxID=4460 RepID=A0A843WW73_COLES|nr:hypothetical protein [Colocasia esculenta]
MASALVNNVGMVAAEGFLDLPPSSAAVSCGWFSPMISFSRELGDDETTDLPAAALSPEKPSFTSLAGKAAEGADLVSPGRDLVMDFEFLRLEDPATMLPADELFCDGKLVPLQGASAQPRPPPLETADSSPPAALAMEDLSVHKLRMGVEASRSEPHAEFSPRAPRCSSRWRELLGLKKAVLDSGTGTAKLDVRRSSPLSAVANLRSPSARSLNRLLHRNRRSCSIDSSMRLPLLQDSDTLVSASVCSCLSLSSSSSDPDHEDLPRLSLDCEKPSHNSVSLGRNPPRFRFASNARSGVDPSPGHFPHRHSTLSASGAAGAGVGGRFGSSPMRKVPKDAVAVPARSTSAESPRMNASGKVVFHSLERSSSSPSTFSGGARVKHGGVERSYSANVVRVSPVLNVPICSLRGSSRAGSVFGFGQLFSASQKKVVSNGSSSSTTARNGGVTGWSTRTERL